MNLSRFWHGGAAASKLRGKQYIMKRAKKSLRLGDGLVRQNIVLIHGLFLTPVVGGAKTLETALTICVVFSGVTFASVLICRLITHLFLREVRFEVRAAIYALVSAIVYIPMFLAAKYVMGDFAVSAAGVYLSVIIANPVILNKTESRLFRRRVKHMLIETAFYIIGFDVVCILIGSIRDIFVNEHLGWLPVKTPFVIPALETAFGGFILAGILAALLKYFYQKSTE